MHSSLSRNPAVALRSNNLIYLPACISSQLNYLLWSGWEPVEKFQLFLYHSLPELEEEWRREARKAENSIATKDLQSIDWEWFLLDFLSLHPLHPGLTPLFEFKIIKRTAERRLNLNSG